MTAGKGFGAAALVAAALAGTPASAEMVRYDIDKDHVSIAFLVDHIGFADTLGLFREVSGHFMFDPETKELGEVTVTIDAASVWTDHDARDGHVRSNDFLAAEAHPEITFTANGGEASGDSAGKVTGDLTVRGETRPVTLDVTLNKIGPYPFGHKKETVGVSVRGAVMRSEFGMTYALGGIVGDEVQLLIEVEAIRAD